MIPLDLEPSNTREFSPAALVRGEPDLAWARFGSPGTDFRPPLISWIPGIRVAS